MFAVFMAVSDILLSVFDNFCPLLLIFSAFPLNCQDLDLDLPRPAQDCSAKLSPNRLNFDSVHYWNPQSAT